jgi:hypothetical protein
MHEQPSIRLSILSKPPHPKVNLISPHKPNHFINLSGRVKGGGSNHIHAKYHMGQRVIFFFFFVSVCFLLDKGVW